ncbi:MAG: putative Ig domain-containing protein [Opitutales bacterium]|nr:putative Ig domain-containing protein [Opitutales bacterium]
MKLAATLPNLSRLLLLSLILLPSLALSEELLNEELRDGSLPDDWTEVDIDFRTAAEGYALFEDQSTSTLTTPTFDASEFVDVRVEFAVAKFGGGDDGPITVEYSLNGGGDWLTAGDSDTPTSATYLPADILIEQASDDMQIRFSRPNSPSGKRFRDVVITGIAENLDPVLTIVPEELDDFTYTEEEGPSAPQSFTISGENLDGSDVVLTAPTSFSLATSETGTYGPSVTLSSYDGSDTILWARLDAGLSVDTYEGQITSTGGDASSIDVNLSGEVVAPPPTPPPLPALTDFGSGDAYTQDFSGFVSAETLPAGWAVDASGSASNKLDFSPWANGGNTSTGVKYSTDSADVLGYQHTGSTGTFTATLTIENQTGETIEALNVSYLGRVERADQTRHPEWTVEVAGDEVGDLSYSTSVGEDQSKVALVTGLFIEPGEAFTVVWSSDGNVGSGGGRRQIGIGDFEIFAAEAGSPVLSREPSSLSGFTYTEGTGPSTAQSFTVSGEDLDGSEVSISSPSAYEFSFSEASGYANPLPLPAFDGEETTIYTRLVSGLNVGTFNESATIAGGGAASLTVSLSGSVTAPPPELTASSPSYSQTFASFDELANLPDGWTLSDSTYGGDWGSGSSGGLRGNDNVLGYQHISSTGVFTATLTLLNDTGETINALDISYLGRVERLDQTRHPEWTVSVDDVVQSGLFYSTESGEDETISALVTELSIPDGESITIVWSSDANVGDSGGRRQIGIGEVAIAVAEVDVLPPLFSVSDGFFMAEQTVFISNFADYSPTTEVFYTLDGSPPTSASTLYDNSLGIPVSTGGAGGTVTLQAIAIDGAEESMVSSATYEFPVKVDDIEALRQQPTGSTPILLNNPAVFTGGTSFRNTKFFQDDSGFGIQIDDPGSGTITTEYEIGDQVGSLYGTLGSFQGQLQFTPLEDPGAPIETGVDIEPVSRTLDTLTDADQARLVVIEGVLFDDADGEATFGGGGSQEDLSDFADPTITGLFRNVFGDSDITDSVIPDGPVTLTGVIQENDDGLNIGPRSLADIEILPVPPEITSPLVASGDINQPFTYTIEATEDPVSFGASGLPSGLSIDTETGIISGTPTESSLTPFEVELAATNGEDLTGTATLELTINPIAVVIDFTGPTSFPFNDSSQSPDFTVDPDVAVEVTYTGTEETSYGPTPEAPTNVGDYLLTVTVTEANHSGEETLAFAITPAPQVITFEALADRDVNEEDFSITATSDSGLPVSFAIDGPATLTDGPESPATVSLAGVEGVVTLTASQEGNDNYQPADEVVRQFTVTAAGQTRFTWDGQDGTIPDADGITTFTIAVPDSGAIESVAVELEISHQWDDLFFPNTEARLLAPEGTDGSAGRAEATLFARGERSANLDEVFMATFTPDISGQEMTGEWTLVIDQTVSGGLPDAELETFALVITVGEPELSPLEAFLDGLPDGQDGLADDASGDGLANLLVFALGGLDPTVSNTTLLPKPVVNGSGELTLTFFRRDGGAAGVGEAYWEVDGLRYRIEGSDDLASWEALAVTESVSTDGVPAGYVRVTTTPDEPVGEEGRGFMRLVVEMVE